LSGQVLPQNLLNLLVIKTAKRKRKQKNGIQKNLVTHNIKEMKVKGLNLKKMKKYHQTLKRLLMMCL